jgi:hypothetical protein
MSDDCALVKAPFQEVDYPVSEALPRVGEAFVEPVTAFLATADMDRKRCRLAQDFAGAMIRLRGRIARGARVQGLRRIHGTMSHRPLMPKTCTTGLPIGRGRSDRCRPAQYRYYRAPEVSGRPSARRLPADGPVAHPGAYLRAYLVSKSLRFERKQVKVSLPGGR